MSEESTPEGNLAEEFQNLGKNLVEALHAAWDHPERKRVQEEVVSGLNELGTTLRNEADSFSESPTGQRLKTDVHTFGERVRNNEMQTKVQQELLQVIKNANSELKKVIDQWSSTPVDQAGQAEAPEEAQPEE